jgi:hypothetical protein
MMTLVSTLILLLPLLPLILLAKATSESLRRAWLTAFCIFLFFNGLWYLIVRLAFLQVGEVRSTLPYLNTEMPSLFEGIGARVMTSFFSDGRLFIIYLLSISLVGYFINKRTIQRTKSTLV